jgi:hypothetical protein
MNKFCPSCGCWALSPEPGAFGELDVRYRCWECDQIWTPVGLEDAYSTMGKPENKKEIHISHYQIFPLPRYVDFGHRHLEKERGGSVIENGEHKFLIPTDLLAITLPAELVAEIESVELVYQKKA